MPVIRVRPRERKEMMIDLFNVTVKKPKVSVEVEIEGLKGSFKLCLEAYFKPHNGEFMPRIDGMGLFLLLSRAPLNHRSYDYH
jgi:hypothetical protein